MKTKQLLSLTIGVLSAFASQAQNTSLASGPSQFQRDFIDKNIVSSAGFFNTVANTSFNYNEEKYRKFKKMRTGGIILTSIGAGMIIGGTALIIAGDNENGGNSLNGDTYYFDDLSDGDSKIVAGAVGIIFGALSTGGGITMWVIGSNKMKKYGGGRVMVQPAKNGMGLAYKF